MGKVRARKIAVRVLVGMTLSCATALGEANPYDTDKGYYNTKGAYNQYNSPEVQARVNGLPGPIQAADRANDILDQQEKDRQANTATCPNIVDCHINAARLPTSFADAVNAREETYKGGVGNTGLVGLDEKLVEVERIASYGAAGATQAGTKLSKRVADMDADPSYSNPNSTRYELKEALREEMNAQLKNAEIFGISANWANRGYRTLIENPDDSKAMGNGQPKVDDPGKVASNAPGSSAPGEIPNNGAGPNGKPGDPTEAPGYGKADKPGDIDKPGNLNASPLEAGRQLAYDILRAEGITPVGSLRAVAVERGDIPAEAGEISAGALKKPDEIKLAKGLDAESLAAGKLAALRKGKELKIVDDDDDNGGVTSGRGAKPKRGSFRNVAPYEDEEPPPAVLRGLSAAQLKDVKLKWRLFRLTQEREALLKESGPMFARLRAEGVMVTTHGQSIFQMAARNFRTFHRWRKPPKLQPVRQLASAPVPRAKPVAVKPSPAKKVATANPRKRRVLR